MFPCSRAQSADSQYGMRAQFSGFQSILVSEKGPPNKEIDCSLSELCVPTSSPSSPVCSGSANRSPPRSDRPLRRRSRLSVSDEELDFRAPGYAQVPPAASGDDDCASFMGNLSEASGSAHLSLRGSANLERSECGVTRGWMPSQGSDPPAGCC